MWHQQIHDKLCDLLKQLDVKIIYVGVSKPLGCHFSTRTVVRYKKASSLHHSRFICHPCHSPMFVGKSAPNLVSFSYSLLILTFAKSLETYSIVLKIVF